MSAVTASGLTLRLGRRTILAGVDLAIEEGAFVGVLGPNGAAKTTLMRAMLGLVPRHPASLPYSDARGAGATPPSATCPRLGP